MAKARQAADLMARPYLGSLLPAHETGVWGQVLSWHAEWQHGLGGGRKTWSSQRLESASMPQQRGPGLYIWRDTSGPEHRLLAGPEGLGGGCSHVPELSS
jgi:hypothetical protein